MLGSRCWLHLVCGVSLLLGGGAEGKGDDRVAAGSLRVPEGYTVELVAGVEHVQHPMMACFDNRGRLYVCESAGTNRQAADLIADPQDSIKVLEDTDGDGRFDKSWTFADKLVFPQGCLWYRGAIYTCSSPYLWKLEDTDGDGVCDQRTILVKSFGFSGNAADIHGPFLSPDGRLFWCDGRHGHEIRDLGETPNGASRFGGDDLSRKIPPNPEPGLPNPTGELISKGKGARIFSCRPDGSDLQVLCGGGMDNPVEIDFWETGEAIGTVNLFYGRPRGDCLVHWVEGGVYPREDQQDCIDEFPWTGGLLGPITNYGHVAVSGCCRYRSDQFPEITTATQPLVLPESADAERATFFVTEFNTHKVVKTILERDGGTFKAIETYDFLTSLDTDFHPTDVFEDADGSLLVINTGGWFRIGCPTSQVAKPEIAGGIYRIRKIGSHQVDDPYGIELAARLQTVSQVDLLPYLGDSRPAVRERAVEIAASRMRTSDQSTLELCQEAYKNGTLSQQLGFVTAAARAGRASYSSHFADAEKATSLRLAVLSLHSLPRGDDVHFDETIEFLLEAGLVSLDSEDTTTARLAIQLLTVVSAHLSREDLDFYAIDRNIIQRLDSGIYDRLLEHSAIVALTRYGNRDRLAASLKRNVHSRRVALIALDQMKDGNLARDEVLPLLNTSDPALLDVVLRVISRRQGWGAETVGTLNGWLADELPEERREIVRQFVAAQLGDTAVQDLVATQIVNLDRPATNRLTLLEAVEVSDLREWPARMDAALTQVLAESEADARLLAVNIIHRRGLPAFDAALRGLAMDANQPTSLRLSAFSAAAGRMSEVDNETHGFLLERLTGNASSLEKLQAAGGLAKAPLNRFQRIDIAERLEQYDTTILPALLPTLIDPECITPAESLLTFLSKSDELPNITEKQLHEVVAPHQQKLRNAIEPVLKRLQERHAAAAAKIEKYLPFTEGGDASRGHYLFFGKTAACSGCHRIGDDGALIGPDLSKIATIRQPRDLVEAIVLPSSSFARGYQSYSVVTKSGVIHTGIISRETAETIVLRRGDLTEVRVPRQEIELLKESEVSIMPQGLETKLNEQELRDLLAYLQSLR